MIEYAEKLPETLYLVTRERVRAGKGIRAVSTKRAEWLFTSKNSVGAEREAWALNIGNTLALLTELFVEEKDARVEMERVIAAEYSLEKERHANIMGKLYASMNSKVSKR